MRTYRLLAILTLAIAICLTALPSHAQTTHSGDISANQTWYASGNPHIVEGDVRVFSATGSCTLTVMPGVMVKFDSSFVMQIGTATQQGVLMAVGTADTSIHFGSNALTPLPGDWSGIHFHSHGSGQMAYCQVKEGGHPGLEANIACASGSNPTIQHCTIVDGGGYGLVIGDEAAPVLLSNTFQDNGAYPVQVYGNNVPLVDISNVFAGKGQNAIEVLSDEITASALWPAHGVPYVVSGDLQISSATGDTLTLEPGAVLRFKPEISLRIGIPGSPGFLLAEGDTNAITFTAADTAKAPYWGGLHFASQGSGLLDGCVVEFGGAGPRMANIYCATASNPVIENCDIKNSLVHGIVCADAALPTISNNIFQQNGQHPIRIYANYVTIIGQGNSAVDNGANAIEVVGDNITSSAIWPNYGIPFALSGVVAVFKPAIGDTLTLEPGVTVSFKPGTGLTIGQDGHSGTLLAQGKPDSVIVFTSAATKGSPGDWQGILCDTLGTALLEHCLVQHGGHGSRDANIAVGRGGNATLLFCTVQQSDGFGILSSGTEALVMATNCTIDSNLIGFSGLGPALTVSSCHIYDNSERGGHNPGNSDNVAATNNWWGHPTGPQDTSPGPPSYNPAGEGDRVTDYVAYDPWWNAPLPSLTTLALSDPSPVRADSVVFTLTFSRKMDPAVDPLVSFSPANPLEGAVVLPDTGWAADSLTWTGTFVFSDITGDGLHTITVSGARDIWDWTMAPDVSHAFYLDTKPPSALASSPAISPVDTFEVGWSAADPSPGSGVAGVTLYVSESDSEWTVWLTESTDTSALFAGQDGHTYFFYAAAADSAGNIEELPAAAECTTHVDAAAPAVPAMLLPVDAAVISDTTPLLTWSAVTKVGARVDLSRRSRADEQTAGTPVEYHLQVGMDDLFDSLLVDQEGLLDTAFIPGALLDGPYYWRVSASDQAGHQSGFAAVPFTFQIDTQPPSITGTTVWPDTSFMGPFPVSTVVDDAFGVSLVLLYYRTSIDTLWKADTMEVVTGRGAYQGQIPELPGPGSSDVSYHIYAKDMAVPPNACTDPPGAPDTVFAFLSFTLHAEEGPSGEIPGTFALNQNYPNPFNAETIIGYEIPATAVSENQIGVHMAIYNVRGQLVRVLVNHPQPAGRYTVLWNGRDDAGRPVSSGIYLVRLQTERFARTRKAVLLR